MNIKSFNSFNEKKSENWIKDAISKPGSLRRKMGKKKGEKISNTEIDSELQALKSKDKDKSKPGTQGLNKKDLKKFRQLNLAKTLKGLKENSDNTNYMFFANLENICRMAREILAMDENQIDEMLSDGHDWANDHISKSMESISHVYNFLNSSDLENEDSFEEEEHFEEPIEESPSEEETNIKSFNNFK
ncbi:MAG: hypothetical protein E6R13_04365 [Spirochaetes bacterium]|nr:MAG: hypothetical protein E6R13_04365 [Spirochaetota bacterium]